MPGVICNNNPGARIAAFGKLHALLEREASRDLFDSYQLFSKLVLDSKTLRLAFVIYAGMRKNWQDIKIDHI